ncbi:hypothetical protein SLS55_006742 [Diplodia seriata]|uniref:Fungal specific transcription factor n=1 Tax=Diplodia seriata TaxID=420778 RepID=A0ABR3CF07_9PEZI
MPLSSERIVSTSTGDVLGSRWGRPHPASAPPPAAHQPTPPTPPPQAAQTKMNGGGDIIGSRRTTAAAPPPEPIVSTIDEGDIIGHARRWVPTIDRRPSTTTTNSNSNSSQLLQQSRYAALSSRPRIPTTTSSSSSPDPDPDPQLSKLKRLIDRLSWKSHTLLFTQSVALSSSSAAATPSYAAQPTTMFKLDFFEYYALLERILVLFLAYFRVPLPSSAYHPSSAALLPTISGRAGWRGQHRYHESVLEALEGAGNEGGDDAAAAGSLLGQALGTGEVVAVLRRAKAFRNRWKDADVEQKEQGWEGQREEVEGLRLGELLEVVLSALERAYRAAEEKGGAAGGGGGGGKGPDGEGTWLEVGGLQHGGGVDEDMEDAPWEAVGDAMEDVMDMDVE